jgi:hypothetical protein
MISLALLGIFLALAALIYAARISRDLKRFEATDRILTVKGEKGDKGDPGKDGLDAKVMAIPLPLDVQAQLDEMRKHVIEAINAVNLLAAETGHSTTSPAGEYRSGQSYTR